MQCVIAMAALTGVYVILGGYMATAINDFIQGIVMLFGIVAVIVAVLDGQGGFYEAIRKLAEIESDIPLTMGQQVVVVPVVSLTTPKMKKEKVDEIFECLDETVTVSRRKSIEE